MNQHSRQVRIVFFASGEFAIPTLARLHGHPGDFELALIVTQPDRPAGRRRELTPTPVARWAADHTIDLVRAQDVNAPDVLQRIASAQPDIFVVIAFGQKMGPQLLARALAINLHGSLLPRYRGAAPIQRAMINGDERSGVSVITVTDRMDAGDVLSQRAVDIETTETAGELHDRLALIGADLVMDVLADFRRRKLKHAPQDESQVTHAPKLSKRDAWVDFAMPARFVRARINGLNPWPGCFVTVNARRLKLLRVVECESGNGSPPGSYLGDGVVQCGPGAVRLLGVQAQGGRAMTFEEFARGRPWPIGLLLERD